MAEDTTRTSNRKLNSGASEYNAISFMMEQQMKGSINTCIPVRVDSCTKPGPNGAAGYVSATPLVMQRGADGNSLAPVSLPQLPFFRLYAGTAAVVIDPQPGDVGLAIFSQQDASNLEAGKNEPVQAGSFRSFDMSDGFYVGGFLGNVPDVYAELEQSTGINIKTPTNTITIGREDGTITIHADTAVNVEAPIAKCSGDVEIAGTLKTGGMATFQQGLQTAAGTNANIGGSLTAAHDISAGGDFSGSGGISLGGSASFGGPMDVTGAATFGGTLDTTGAATFGGAASFANTITATGAATFNSTLDVANALTAGSLVTGDITSDGDLSITGDTTIDGDLTITGGISSTGGVTFDGDITVNGDIEATGRIEAEGAWIKNSNLVVDEDIFARNAEFAQVTAPDIATMSVTSTTHAPSVLVFDSSLITFKTETLAVNGISTGSVGNLNVSGNTTVTGNVRSEGTITAPVIQQDPASP